MPWRRLLLWIGIPLLALVALFAYQWLTYPRDTTPEGAYLRVMSGVNRGKPEAFFAYIETAAQHGCYTIRDFRKKAVARVRAAYPKDEQAAIVERYEAAASAPDGADIFALYARREGWLERLRRDMSGIAKVEIQGDRATVETVRGTRYPFRRRENGIWGLTLFTATLVTEAERAARDYSLIEQAAQDYERVRAREGEP